MICGKLGAKRCIPVAIAVVAIVGVVWVIQGAQQQFTSEITAAVEQMRGYGVGKTIEGKDVRFSIKDATVEEDGLFSVGNTISGTLVLSVTDHGVTTKTEMPFTDFHIFSTHTVFNAFKTLGVEYEGDSGIKVYEQGKQVGEGRLALGLDVEISESDHKDGELYGSMNVNGLDLSLSSFGKDAVSVSFHADTFTISNSDEVVGLRSQLKAVGVELKNNTENRTLFAVDSLLMDMDDCSGECLVRFDAKSKFEGDILNVSGKFEKDMVRIGLDVEVNKKEVLTSLLANDGKLGRAVATSIWEKGKKTDVGRKSRVDIVAGKGIYVNGDPLRL